MKKTLLIIVIVFVVITGALVSVPLFFKDALLEKTKTTINKQINAEVDFKGFKLSWFRSFPRITIELKKVTVIGKDEFQADTLLFIENARAKMSLASLFKNSERSIEEISLINPNFRFVVGKSGNANWDIAKETPVEQKPVESVKEQEEPFKLQLERIEVKKGMLVYEDREINMLNVFENINLDINGQMFGTSTSLIVSGKSGGYTLVYDSVKYISNVALETVSRLNVDYEKMDIAIVENELLVNRLPLQVTGLIQIPSDSMFFDLQLKTKDSGFENFLALVPPGYEDYLKKVKTSGTATISGTIKGMYYEEIYPSFDLKIDMSDGNLKYADLPEEIKNIKAAVSVTKPEGDLDLTEIWIKNAHAEVKNSPVDLTLRINRLFSDPYFDGAFVGTVNFSHLKDALPLDSVNFSGIIDANLFVKGNYSDIQKEQYDKIRADGIVMLNNFLYESPKLTREIIIPEGKLDFSPQNVTLSRLSVKIGQSDFNLSGKVHNYLNYVLKDGTLQGDVQLVSSFMNINELLRLQKENDKVQTKGKKASKPPVSDNQKENSEILAFDIPKNIDITFRSNIEKALFDKLEISKANGLITAKNGKLLLNGLTMNTLDGELKLTGSYENTVQNQPLVDFGFEVLKFDIPVAFQSLTGFQKIAPVAAHSRGKISTDFKIKGQLTPDFKIIPVSVNGLGLFNTENLRIIDSPVFKQLKGIILPEKLQNVEIADFKANFNIENGNIDLKPFKTTVAGQETTILGTLNAENLINIRLSFNINRDAFGNEIQGILNVIPGNRNISVVPAAVTINGPVNKPEVKLDLSETRKTITNAAKEGIQESTKKLGKELQKLIGK